MQVVHKAVGQISAPGSLGPDTRTSGSHVGGVDVELVDSSERNVRSNEIIAEWRKLSGDFPGAESVTFGTPNFGPGGRPIEFKLLADRDDMAQLEAAVEETKAKLAEYGGRVRRGRRLATRQVGIPAAGQAQRHGHGHSAGRPGRDGARRRTTAKK